MTPDPDRLLSELREEFTVMAGARFSEMETLLSRLEAGPDEEALLALRRNGHGLAGSGGSVGLPEVTRLARKLEGECRLLIESGRHPAERDLAGWVAALVALRAEVGIGQ